MAKRIDDFVSSHVGRWYGSGQCYAGTEEYLSWGLDTRVTVPGYGTAWAWGCNWQSTVLASCCTQVSEPVDGDIIFWDNHTCIYYQGKCFGQNQGTNGAGGVFNLINVVIPAQHIYLRPNFISHLGWIIPSENRGLSQSEMENNAKCLYGYLHNIHGFTLQACCGILGNAQGESSINPNRSEIGGTGYGLVQWTPGSRCTSYLNSRGASLEDYGNMECDLIAIGDGWISSKSYPMTWAAYINSTESPGYLAMVYLANLERPASMNNPALQIRSTWANNWYNYLCNWEPETPAGVTRDGIQYRNVVTLETVLGIVHQMYYTTIIINR